uniref:Uncharacterized protein n=1 Tax=Panagrolaimus davidi TaxID=227884 RepID=A0A914QPS8_9BILA
MSNGTAGFINGSINAASVQKIQCVIDVQKLQIDGDVDSMDKLQLDTEWFILHGNLKNNKEVDIKNWGMLSTGNIKNTDSLIIDSYFVCTNTGQLEAKKSKIKAPFLFHVRFDDKDAALGIDTKNVDSLLSIESIIFACGESKLEAESIQNSTVLLFRFASLTATTTPDHDQLTHWNNTVKRLSNAFSSADKPSDETIKNLFSVYNEGAAANQHASEIDLNSHIQFYIEVKAIAQNLKQNGIQTFDHNDLIDALKRAHYQENLKQFNLLIDRCLSVKIYKFMRDLFLSKASLVGFQKKLGFDDLPSINQNKKGYQSVGYWGINVGGHVEASGDGIYENFTKNWISHGSYNSAGDIEISSNSIYQSKYGNMVAMLGSIFFQGNDGKFENVKSAKEIWADFAQDFEAQNVVSKIAKISANNIAINDIKSDEACIKAGNVAKVHNFQAHNVSIEAQNNVEADGIGENVTIISDKANVKASGKIQAENLSISASEFIDLVFDYGSNHQVGKINAKCRHMNNIQEFLHGTGVFNDMHVRNQLGLEASDEAVFLSNLHRNCSIEVKAKSIDIVGANSSAKSMKLEANDHLQVHHRSSINAGEDIVLRLNSNYELKIGNAQIRAGRNAKISAVRNVETVPEVIQFSQSSTKRRWGKKRTTWTTTTYVYGANITAGQELMFASDYESVIFESANLTATNLGLFATNGGVSLRGRTGGTTTSTKRSSFFGAFNKKSGSSDQTWHPTRVNANLISQARDFESTGSQINSPMAFIKAENVKLSGKKLAKQSFTAKQSIHGIGFQQNHSNQCQEYLADSYFNSCISTIKAKSLEVIEGYRINVAKEFFVNAEKATFEGAELHSYQSSSKFKTEYLLLSRTIKFREDTVTMSSMQRSNQVTNVGEKSVFHLRDATMKDANLNTNEFLGMIDDLQIVSNVSTKAGFSRKNEYEITFACINGVIVPIPGYSIAETEFTEQKVLQQSGVYSRKGIFDNLEIRHLMLQGGYIISDGEIKKFYQHCEKKDVFESSTFEANSSSFAVELDNNSHVQSVAIGQAEANFGVEATLSSTIGNISDLQNSRRVTNQWNKKESKFCF